MGMIGIVAKGGSLENKVEFNKLWYAAVEFDHTVTFKSSHFKKGTNCVAFCLYLTDSLLISSRRE